MMVREGMTFRCPRYASIINIDKKVARTDVLLYLTCLEGEITCQASQTKTEQVIGTLPTEAKEWVVGSYPSLLIQQPTRKGC
jgi:hypothetical protein